MLSITCSRRPVAGQRASPLATPVAASEVDAVDVFFGRTYRAQGMNNDATTWR
jgi:hypothetical protein